MQIRLSVLSPHRLDVVMLHQQSSSVRYFKPLVHHAHRPISSTENRLTTAAVFLGLVQAARASWNFAMRSLIVSASSCPSLVFSYCGKLTIFADFIAMNRQASALIQRVAQI